MKILIALILLASLIGCGGNRTLYHRAGATQSDWNKDYWECQIYANQMGAAMSGGVGSGNSGSMGSAMGGGIASGIIHAVEYNRHLSDCLRAKGWNPR